MILSVRIIALMVFAAILCPTPISGAYDLSIEEERAAGEEFLIDIRKKFQIIGDDYLNSYINELGQYLLKSLETKPFSFHFYLIQENTLNGFAGPGGHIFLFSGLIETMDQVDELAAVICHEIGHVSARHLAQRLEQSKKIGMATMASVLAAVLVGGKAGGAILSGSMAAGMQASLHYSREDERQADQLGFKYMEASGYHPSGMIQVLKKLQMGQWGGTDDIPPYLLTHPVGPERISRIEIMLENYTEKLQSPEASRLSDDFPVFKTILRARYLDPYEAERLFSMDLRKDPQSGLAHLGLGIVWNRRSEYGKAVEHLEAALELLPGVVSVLSHLGEAYQLQGRDREAIRVLNKALEVNSRDKTSLSLLAASYQNLEDYSKAIRLYERLSAMKPVKDEVFYNLGVAYGRQNHLDLAHYNFGLFFQRQKNKKKALFHFEKAEDFARGNPGMKEKIRKAKKDLLEPPPQD